ncbi:MAG: hypothetical protein FWC66_05180 [Oscillospiraceae bacterium]|nr:hypothetical protein [Oscillospiraceae bacterium]
MSVSPVATNPSAKQDRFQRQFFVDTRIDPAVGAPELYLIGEDNDDLSRDISWNNETTRNVLGRRVSSSTRSDEGVSTDPFYARQDDPLGLLLQHLDETKAELDAIKRDFYEAKVDNDGVTIYAFKQIADLMVQSAGGAAADADNIPFDIALSGARVEQDFDFATQTFSDV